MHFEILVEGQSDLTALSSGIIQNIVGEYNNPHTWKIHKHQGIGVANPNPKAPPNIKDRTLLHNLPSKLRAYGNSLTENQIVLVLIDLDNKTLAERLDEFTTAMNTCNPAPRVIFSVAIEEMEAWFLGDVAAIQLAYPDARIELLDRYVQDSQCGTWETLAEIVYPGGYKNLAASGKRSIEILDQKWAWAKTISPYMRKENNVSPSFQYFCTKITDAINSVNP